MTGSDQTLENGTEIRVNCEHGSQFQGRTGVVVDQGNKPGEVLVTLDPMRKVVFAFDVDELEIRDV